MSLRGIKIEPKNPWHILATLFGGQAGESVDHDLHEKNKRAWNAWALSLVDKNERENLIDKYRVFDGDVDAWSQYEGRFHARLDELELGMIAESYKNRIRRNGLISIPRPNEVIEFSGVTFSDLVCFDDFFFPCSANFNDSVFLGMLEAKGVIFSESAAFNRVEFGGIVDFSDSTFLHGAHFNNAKFKNEAHLMNVNFSKSSSFRRANFENIANFQSANFRKNASFGSTNMHEEVSFIKANFDEGVSFWQTNFLGRLTMVEATISGGVNSKAPDFSDATFQLPANFRQTKFIDVYPNFRGTLLHDRTIFSAEENVWPKQVTKNISEAKEACSLLRNIVERQGFIEDAHFFFRREMGFACRIGGLLQRLPYLAYGYFSDFGYSIARPLLWLAVVFWLGFVLFCGGFYVEGVQSPVKASLALSLNNIFPFFGFARSYLGADFLVSLHVLKKVISATQSIIALPLVFLLGLGLRTRFRMR